jgi:hypothetical protein
VRPFNVELQPCPEKLKKQLTPLDFGLNFRPSTCPRTLRIFSFLRVPNLATGELWKSSRDDFR